MKVKDQGGQAPPSSAGLLPPKAPVIEVTTFQGTWKVVRPTNGLVVPDSFETAVTSEAGPVGTGSGAHLVTVDEVELARIKAERMARASVPVAPLESIQIKPRIDPLTNRPDFSFTPDIGVTMVEAAFTAYQKGDVAAAQANALGFSDVSVFTKQQTMEYAKRLPGFFRKFFTRDVEAGLAASKDALVVTWRGTESEKWEDLLKDLATDIAVLKPVDDPRLGKLHRGFTEAKNLIKDEMTAKIREHWEDDIKEGKPPRPLYITGHSMGGALATLFAAHASELIQEMEEKHPGKVFNIGGVYTFGSPHVGIGDDFVSKYDNLRAGGGATLADRTYQLAIEGDPVTGVPSLFHDWRHAAMKNYRTFQVGLGLEGPGDADTLPIREVVLGGHRDGPQNDPTAPPRSEHHRIDAYRKLMRSLKYYPEFQGRL